MREKLGVLTTNVDLGSATLESQDVCNKAYSWLDEMELQLPRKANEDDNFMFAMVWRILARRKDQRRLERLLVCMHSMGAPTNVCMYTQLISRLGRRGKMEEAKTWFDNMQEAGLTPDAQAYSALIHCCAHRGKTEEANQWYEKMIAHGVCPTEITFNSLVNACAQSAKPELGEQWVERMEAVGVQPTVCTFNALIHATTKTGRTERAEFWLMEILRRGMEPDIVSYSTIIHSLSFRKNPRRVMQADRLMRLMLSRGVTCARQMGYNFRCVIIICARGKELDLAKYWLNVAERRDANAGKYAYKFVACALDMVGRCEEARVIRSRMERYSAVNESSQGDELSKNSETAPCREEEFSKGLESAPWRGLKHSTEEADHSLPRSPP